MSTSHPFARIVVGYDGSPAADAALQQAAALAELHGGDVVAVHLSSGTGASVLPLNAPACAAEPDRVPVLGSLEPYRHDLFYKVSAKVAACAAPVSMEFATNAPAAGILDAALRWNASAIALGTHARTGLAHVFAGSVAEEVLRRAELPVIVTREGSARAALERLVVGIDASEPASDAVSFALGMGRAQPLRLLYCTVTDTASIGGPDLEPSFDPTPLLSAMRAAARDALDAALQNAQEAGLHPDTELTDAIDAGAGLCEVARRHRADAIVIGNHRRGALARFFLGSTAAAVLRHADRPVIVVPAQAKAAAGAPAAVPSER